MATIVQFQIWATFSVLYLLADVAASSNYFTLKSCKFYECDICYEQPTSSCGTYDCSACRTVAICDFFPYFGLGSIVLLISFIMFAYLMMISKKNVIYRSVSACFTTTLISNFLFSCITFALSLSYFISGQSPGSCTKNMPCTCLGRNDAFYLWFVVQGIGIIYWAKNVFHKCCCWGEGKYRASALNFWKSTFFPLASQDYFEGLAQKYEIKKWSWNNEREEDEEKSHNTKYEPSIAMDDTKSSGTVGHKVITDIVVKDKLGGGYFGEVYKGVWHKTTEVALKTVLDSNMNEEILKEIDILEKLAHPNIVAYLGLYTASTGQLYLVTEFMNRGSLDKMIVQNKDNITLLDLLAMAKQAAAGMQYLESQNIVHRDLALRNLLVATRGDKYERFVVKVADFGLSRTTDKGYYKSESKTIPVKWSALEIVLYDSYKYTSKVLMYFTPSNVISAMYGLSVLPCGSYGVTPYPGMSHQECVSFLRKGGRLECPDKCPSELYTLMFQCWKEDPDDRPNFEQIFDLINAMFEKMLPVESNEDQNDEERAPTAWMPPSTSYGSNYESNGNASNYNRRSLMKSDVQYINN